MGFLVKLQTGVPINREHALSGTEFAVQTAVGNKQIQFNFEWNSKFQHYTVDVLDSASQRLLRFYPEPNEFHLVPNFDPDSFRAPDARIGIVEHGEEEVDVTPETIGKRHNPYIMQGVITNL